MIKKLEIFSMLPGAPELPLGGLTPHSDPLQLRNVEGLEPVKANIATTPLASGRGEVYQGGTTGKRNIVLTIGFAPDWIEETVATLRQTLYRYFMPEQWTKLRLFSDHLPTVDIEGYVESCEPNIFTQDPEMIVSVICPKPDFIEADATIYYGVVDDGTIELEFDYIGSVPTGFELRIEASVDNPSYTGPFTVINKAPIEPQTFEVTPVTVDPTQYFKLSTIPNAKRVQSIAVADGAVTNLLSRMSLTSEWAQIKQGENVFSVAAEESGQDWTMAYFNRFGGM